MTPSAECRMPLSLSDYDFNLPKELIAAYPPADRPSARLLCLDRGTGALQEKTFRDITQFLKAGDVLVLNNTKVLPARIFGTKKTGGSVEALLLKEKANQVWETLLRPGKRVKKGVVLTFAEKGLSVEAEVLDDGQQDSGIRTLRFLSPDAKGILLQIGHIPLPPYLDRPDSEIDREMYQTVFARREGAVASPTAGLHFDNALLEAIAAKGIEIVYVTLHTSYGTFQPISDEVFEKNELFREAYEIPSESAAVLNKAMAEGRRVIACGTTSVRALESAASGKGKIEAKAGETKIFIYPPYSFKIIGGLITNFHLPKSSLLLLVSAFSGKENLDKAYQKAIAEKYRFYSYGDAMLIL